MKIPEYFTVKTRDFVVFLVVLFITSFIIFDIVSKKLSRQDYKILVLESSLRVYEERWHKLSVTTNNLWEEVDVLEKFLEILKGKLDENRKLTNAQKSPSTDHRNP